jgi:hypothetical protein
MSIGWLKYLAEGRMQKTQNNALRKITGTFKSAPIKAIQRDANILPLNVSMKKIRRRFAI